MELSVLLIFVAVYIGMAIGNWPGLALDRTGIALVGAIGMIAGQRLTLEEAVADMDFSSIVILFSFMIISAQFYFSGFYTYVTVRLARWDASPRYFLLAVIFISGILSAVLINDIVCLAMTPLLIRITLQKKLNPIPFLLGLCAGSNIGSALTLVGNPQNMLIGQVLHIPFAQYTIDALLPCVLGLFAAWGVINFQTAGQWYAKESEIVFESPVFKPWMSLKGLIVVTVLIAIFLIVDAPRENIALIAAGSLLFSRQMASRKILSFIDWQLLVLFAGLFVVNREFNRSEILQSFVHSLHSNPADLQSPSTIFIVSALLSNIISNVPAVMLLLPYVTGELGGSLLALSSTLAGNMFIVGSIANIIVVNQASDYGIRITWRKHMASGLPISLITLGLAALWLYLRYS